MTAKKVFRDPTGKAYSYENCEDPIGACIEATQRYYAALYDREEE